MPSSPGQTLRLTPGADPGDVVGVEREALALDLDLAAAAQGHEDLLLAVLARGRVRGSSRSWAACR